MRFIHDTQTAAYMEISYDNFNAASAMSFGKKKERSKQNHVPMAA